MKIDKNAYGVVLGFGISGAIICWLFLSGVWTRYAPVWREYILWLVGDPRLVIGMAIGIIITGLVAFILFKAEYGLPPEATNEDLLASIQDELDNLTEILMQVAG